LNSGFYARTLDIELSEQAGLDCRIPRKAVDSHDKPICGKTLNEYNSAFIAYFIPEIHSAKVDSFFRVVN